MMAKMLKIWSHKDWWENCHKMYQISDEVVKLTKETVKNRTVELTVGGNSLAKVKIQRYIPGKCAITITICDSDDTS